MTASLALNGTWEIIFDHENRGRDARWHLADSFAVEPTKRALDVPSCWEEIEKDYEGVAYYRHTFGVPKEWEGRTTRLRFDAVNFMAEVWLNDRALGVHEGGFTPFEFRVEKMLKPGEENTLTVRVAGPILMESKRIEGVGQRETPQWRGAITGGIWQPVELVSTGDAYVRDVFIEPRIEDDTATFHVELEHSADARTEAELRIAARPDGESAHATTEIHETVELRPGKNSRTWTLPIPDARYWSPDEPNLYRAEVSVKLDGVVSDVWSARFGLREFTLRDGRFCLNGEPLFLKATFFEGLYPTKLAYPDSREMMAREIQLARDAGFNMIRPWRKPPPPVWLDLAEEMGVLTVGSLAIECMEFPVESARLPGWVANEVRESVLRDRNRACVVQWELFNEICRPVLAQMLHPMAMLARELDPTRMILDESGGWAQGANLYLPWESEPTKFNDVHCYPGPQINDEVYSGLQAVGDKSEEEARGLGITGPLPGRNVVTGLPTYFSELGYGSLPDLVDNNARFAEHGNPIVPPTVYHRRLADEHEQALAESGFDAVYPDLQQFCLDQQRLHGAANKRMIEAVRCNPAVIGYCIHALSAGDWIMGAGLLDLWRNPKTRAYEDTKAANQPRLLSIRVRPRNVYAERGTRIEVTGVNELAATKGELNVQVTDRDGQTVQAEQVDAQLASGITALFDQPLDTSSLRGTYAVTVQLTPADGSPRVESTRDFDVFAAEDLVAPEARVAVLDANNSLKPFLGRNGIEFVDFGETDDVSLAVFVSWIATDNPGQQRQLAELTEFIESGGTAVYVAGIGQWPRQWIGTNEIDSPVPVHGHLRRAVGLWTCIPHLVRDHPIFEGLPTNGPMGSVYENVWAENTLAGIGGEAIVGSIGFDWYPDGDKKRRHYYGPGDTWWGADVAEVPLGKGRLIVSQLRLLQNLGKDPVTDRILFNLIRYVA